MSSNCFSISYQITNNDSGNPNLTISYPASVPNISTNVYEMIQELVTTLSNTTLTSSDKTHVNELISSLKGKFSSMSNGDSLNSSLDELVSPSNKNSLNSNGKKLSQNYKMSGTGNSSKTEETKSLNTNVQKTQTERNSSSKTLSGISNSLDKISTSVEILSENDQKLLSFIKELSSTLSTKKSTVGTSSMTTKNSSSESDLETSFSNLNESFTQASIGNSSISQNSKNLFRLLGKSVSSKKTSDISLNYQNFKNSLSASVISKISTDMSNFELSLENLQSSGTVDMSSSSNQSRFLLNRLLNVKGGSMITDSGNAEIIKNAISKLEKEKSSLTEQYLEKLTNGNITSEEINSYSTSMENLSNEINNLNSQIGNSSSTRRTVPGTLRNIGRNIGQSQAGKLLKIFSGAARTGKTISDSDRKDIESASSNLNIEVPNSSENQQKTVGFLGSLSVNAIQNDSSVTVNYSGVLNNSSFSGSYVCNTSSLEFILFKVLNSKYDTMNSQIQKIYSKYSVSGMINTTDLKKMFWNLFLINIYTYLSIISYIMLNGNNSFGLTIPVENSQNMTSFLENELYTNLGSVSLPISSSFSSQDDKNILDMSNTNFWSGIIYGSDNEKSLSSNIFGQSLQNFIKNLKD